MFDNARELTLSTATDEDDLRQFRDVLRGALAAVKDGVAPNVEAEWSENWTVVAELGATSFCVPEANGGFGFEVEAAVVAAEELGAALHPSPYAGLTASVHALARSGDPTDDDLVAGIVAGTSVCAFGMITSSTGSAWVVDGASDADALVLSDRSADDLVLVTDRSAWTVHPESRPFDVSRRCGAVDVDVARGREIGGAGVARNLYGQLLAADALGCVQRMLDRTVRYAGQRQAFGRAIGGYQAVQHRLVDHTVRARGMALLVSEAARLLASGSPDATRSVALAEIAVSSGAVHILHDLLQLTGAIGFTWEYGLHFFERRAHQDARLAANPRAAVRSLAGIEGWAHGD